MLQRTQTLFLILAIAMLGLLYVLPLAQYNGGDPGDHWELWVWGLRLVDGTAVPDVGLQVPLAALVGVVMLVLAVAVALYRNRHRQLRFVRMGALFVAALGVALAITHSSVTGYLEQNRILATALAPGFFIPFPVLLFCFLAMRGIRKDEELVKSADRLR